MSIEIRDVPLATVWHIRKTVMYPGLDLEAVSRMFSRLLENHTRRMAALGLQS